MREITKADVEAYVLGQIHDNELRAAIEHARQFDPVVSLWFDAWDASRKEKKVADIFQRQGKALAKRLFQPDTITVVRNDANWYADRHIVWAGHVDNRNDPVPLKPWQLDELPSIEVDQEERLVRFTWSAADVPYGVARIKAVLKDESETFVLAAFREQSCGEQTIRQAEVSFADLGIPRNRNVNVRFYVTPAKNDNLREFAMQEVQALCDRCNGNSELREAAELLLNRLTQI